MDDRRTCIKENNDDNDKLDDLLMEKSNEVFPNNATEYGFTFYCYVTVG